jgi:acylphosphatase
MNEKLQMHVRVSGHVQGVGFRYYVRQQAGDLPITGWVRNVSDGRVEVAAEGERADLETFLAAVRRGPSASAVTEVEVDWRPAAGLWSTFSITPSE